MHQRRAKVGNRPVRAIPRQTRAKVQRGNFPHWDRLLIQGLEREGRTRHTKRHATIAMLARMTQYTFTFSCRAASATTAMIAWKIDHCTD